MVLVLFLLAVFFLVMCFLLLGRQGKSKWNVSRMRYSNVVTQKGVGKRRAPNNSTNSSSSFVSSLTLRSCSMASKCNLECVRSALHHWYFLSKVHLVVLSASSSISLLAARQGADMVRVVGLGGMILGEEKWGSKVPPAFTRITYTAKFWIELDVAAKTKHFSKTMLQKTMPCFRKVCFLKSNATKQ